MSEGAATPTPEQANTEQARQPQTSPDPASPEGKRREGWLIPGILLLPETHLALAVLGFLAWIGYLAFLAFTVSRPTIVSRPQLLAAQLDVVAVIDAKEDGGPDTRVVIDEQLWSSDDQVKPRSKSVQVINLPQATGWQGPGLYFIPLVQRGEAYSIAPLALSPGYGGRNDLRIYKVTPEVLRQERDFRSAAR